MVIIERGRGTEAPPIQGQDLALLQYLPKVEVAGGIGRGGEGESLSILREETEFQKFRGGWIVVEFYGSFESDL